MVVNLEQIDSHFVDFTCKSIANSEMWSIYSFVENLLQLVVNTTGSN